MKNSVLIKSVKFFALSGLGWLIDVIVLLCCVNWLKWNIFEANCLSSFVAITVVFFVSTKTIFDKKQTRVNLKVKYLIYCVYQVILIIGISLLAVPINNWIQSELYTFDVLVNHAAFFTKICITPITMLLNFLVMKFLMEKI